VGLFSAKRTVTTDFEIISAVVESLVRGLLTIIRDDVIDAKDTAEYWALIVACSDRYISTAENRSTIQDQIIGRIRDAIQLSVRDRKTDSQILDAYTKRLDIPFPQLLYTDYSEKDYLNGERIIGSLLDLINQIINEAPRDIYKRSVELTWPLFTHYCGEGAIRAESDLEEIIFLRNILVIAFSISLADILSVRQRNPRELTQHKLQLLNTMVASCILSWAVRDFGIRYLEKNPDKLGQFNETGALNATDK
jgi:hypothetical protein